ncbi:uncharacterized protein LOC132736428 [Ruditapes philippinarum]|uniref:uncharacterized protein LOC132736428 n=1 Tax=Ruditapes philippinarum TaxID=129788 RepID=UPI00295B0976|nr:uncharacterized protein LOC132736428 [Ruditapes philippinarum]
MFLLILVSALFLDAVQCATTVSPVKILYDFHHKKAMIVRADGCYEYHMNHQDTVDAKDDTARPVLEARMLAELATAINIVETGHHHIDHMTQEIKTACASLPVYGWDLPTVGSTVPNVSSP